MKSGNKWKRREKYFNNGIDPEIGIMYEEGDNIGLSDDVIAHKHNKVYCHSCGCVVVRYGRVEERIVTGPADIPFCIDCFEDSNDFLPIATNVSL
jgi:hypothetical protein